MLSAQHVQAFYVRMTDKGLYPSTVVYHSILHNALGKAVKWELVPRNVCDLVTPPRKARFEIQPFTPEQVQSFISAIRGHKWEALFTLDLAIDMRQGELLGLKWQDINFTAGVMQVRRILTRVPSRTSVKVFTEAEPKTQYSRRSITIAAFALESLRQHRLHRKGSLFQATFAELVFFAATYGTWLRTIVSSLCAKISKRSQHRQRYSPISKLVL
jgi:integrase